MRGRTPLATPVQNKRLTSSFLAVFSLSWVVFEEPGFSGEPYILEKGLYGCQEDWGALQPRIASAMPVVMVRAATPGPRLPALRGNRDAPYPASTACGVFTRAAQPNHISCNFRHLAVAQYCLTLTSPCCPSLAKRALSLRVTGWSQHSCL